VPARILVRLQPRASKNEVTGERDGKVCVRVTAPPVDGKANQALIKLVAGRTGIARGRVSIVRGETSRDKLLEIDGATGPEIRAKLLGAAGRPGRPGRADLSPLSGSGPA
jgi:uncharacterized protein (TIGR00251 family)